MTQLYETLPHELGHQVDYKESLDEPFHDLLVASEQAFDRWVEGDVNDEGLEARFSKADEGSRSSRMRRME